MHRIWASVGSPAAAVVLALTVGGVGPAAGESAEPVVVDGVSECNVDAGDAPYMLQWTVTNNTGSTLWMTVLSVESGAIDGTVALTPNPVPVGGVATATSSAPNVEGVVTLTVGWNADGPQFPVTTSAGSITLDGSCALATATTIPPTTAVQSAAVAQPHFTG